MPMIGLLGQQQDAITWAWMHVTQLLKLRSGQSSNRHRGSSNSNIDFFALPVVPHNTERADTNDRGETCQRSGTDVRLL